MNWEAVSAITEVVGTFAILITLIYLSRQIRDGNRQAELEGMRYTLNGFRCGARETWRRPLLGLAVTSGPWHSVFLF